MNGKALVLALVAFVATACASGAGAGPATGGPNLRDNDATKAASVHLVQAGLAEGAEAQDLFQQALTDALQAIEQVPDNPKGYFLAGQAAAGLHDWVQADTMFDRALAMYPEYEQDVEIEREQAWANAYNLGAMALQEDDLDRAILMFEGADRIYQGRPDARLALGTVYVNRGDTEAAAEAYLGALEILDAPAPEQMDTTQKADWVQSRRLAAFNASQLLATTGDAERAADVMQGFLDSYAAELDPQTVRQGRSLLAGFLAQAGDAEAAEAMYDEILSEEGVSSDEYFQAGIGFFNTGDYGRAAEAFAAAAELNPYSRDAHLNLVQSLYSRAVELEETEETDARNEELREIYQRILDEAGEVRELDPLNRNVMSFMLRAYRALADLSPAAQAQEMNQQMQNLFRVYQEQEYEVTDVQIAMQSPDEARVTGTFSNLAGTAGGQVQLQFNLLSDTGQVIDRAEILVNAPEQGSATGFQASLDVPGGEFAGWSYELVQ